MSEIPSSINKETVKSKNIYKITDKTDTIIACIQGSNSSPKITQELFEKGYENFACLSGGITYLSDYLEDTETSNIINSSFYDGEQNLKMRRLIKQQTDCDSLSEYYGKLADKKILIITHGLFMNLTESKTEEFFKENNIEFSYYSKSERLRQDLLRKNPDLL